MSRDAAADPLVDVLLAALKGLDARWQQQHEDVRGRLLILEQRATQPITVQGPPGEQGPPGRDGRDGLDADSRELAALQGDVKGLREAIDTIKADALNVVTKELTAIPSVDESTVRAMVQKEVSTAVASIPVPKDGQDGKDGTGVTVADVEPLITREIQKAIAAFPAPKDGRDGIDGKDGASVTVADLEPVITREVQQAVKAIPPATNGQDGKDGIGVLGALLDRQGHLVLTLSDGTTRDVGLVMGKDVDHSDVERVIREEVAKIPTPRDGIDGKDGLGFDDFALAYDPTSGYRLRLAQGERVKEFPVSIPHDAGVYQKSVSYVPGSCVTWANSYWIATAQTDDVPGNGATAWRMVARGIQGKAGPKGDRGDKGERGERGPQGVPAKF
jgi:hypothetical protein